MVYQRKMPAKAKIPQQPARLGAMTPEEFAASLSLSLGGRGWQKSWCRGTGQFGSTLGRYLRGEYPIPQYVALIVEMLATLRLHGLPAPDAFSAENDGLRGGPEGEAPVPGPDPHARRIAKMTEQAKQDSERVHQPKQDSGRVLRSKPDSKKVPKSRK